MGNEAETNKWTEEMKNEKVEEIFETFHTGGTHAHNTIQWGLTALAKHDKKLADETFKTLQEMGY